MQERADRSTAREWPAAGRALPASSAAPPPTSVRQLSSYATTTLKSVVLGGGRKCNLEMFLFYFMKIWMSVGKDYLSKTVKILIEMTASRRCLKHEHFSVHHLWYASEESPANQTSRLHCLKVKIFSFHYLLHIINSENLLHHFDFYPHCLLLLLYLFLALRAFFVCT